ncbi:hypothetical protein [Pedobacter namyangjuensis]|uniref:hypothetical protein n=1 Tax=Pedobacter namyangjuensis TaxID=600626 RepID=UPI000DE234AF|nr:hypothetical protein [Pedobacter namyangjuensis]
MKKILTICLLLAFSYSVNAQKVNPEIKEGTSLIASAFVQGQEVPLVLSIKKVGKPFSLAWSVEGYGDGVFEMTENAVANGTKMAMPTQPASGVTKLDDTETFGLISKASFKSLVDNKEFALNGVKFKVKATTTAFKIGGKEVDVFNVASAEGKSEMWILNNANFPMVLQTAQMPIDITVHEIK